MKDKKIVMLAGKDDTTNIVYNALIKEFNIISVILEEPIPKKIFLNRRIKKLGIYKVFGQILFQIIIVPYLNIISNKRKKEILKTYQLVANGIPASKIIPVHSVNHPSCIDSLLRLQPDIVIVNGTRIISQSILNTINAKFINTHVGITPKYRGVHGGYWALAHNDKENCGVTIHFVDKGIDTGEIIYQKQITPTSKDNFATYPFLQLAEGIASLKKAIENTLNGTVVTRQNNMESHLWYHPTIWQYLYNWVQKGIK